MSSTLCVEHLFLSLNSSTLFNTHFWRNRFFRNGNKNRANSKAGNSERDGRDIPFRTFRASAYSASSSSPSPRSAASGGWSGNTGSGNLNPWSTEVLVSGENLSKSYDGLQILFENLNITIYKGQKLGLLGANGCGKSTLLKILSGKETADEGTLQFRKGLEIGYLPQDPNFDESLSILDAVLSVDSPKIQAVRNYETLLERIESRKQGVVGSSGSVESLENLENALQSAISVMEELEAWDIASAAEKFLELLGLGKSTWQRPVGSLSGGQKKRVALASALLSAPDVLLLDEPTNHMDIVAIEWMEKFLSSSDRTAIVVSHDRYFLDSICSHMLEVEKGSSFLHKGNYSDYLMSRQKRWEEAEAMVEKLENTLRREGEWARKQPKARSTKSRSRLDRFSTLTKLHSEKESFLKRKEEATLRLSEEIAGDVRMGKKVLKIIQGTAKRGDRTIFEGFSYEFGKGDRLGVVGRNGVGKSTFLDCIAGLLELESGVREVGETVSFAYFSQETPPISSSSIRMIDYVQEFGQQFVFKKKAKKWSNSGQVSSPSSPASPSASSSPPLSASGTEQGAVQKEKETSISASKLLEQFGFPRAKHYIPLEKLSGGERRRLFLCSLLLSQPNFLIMDEPSNDLDLQTVLALESFILNSFEGCLLVASHDRWFMSGVVQKLFFLPGNGEIRLYDGTYFEFLEDYGLGEVGGKGQVVEERGLGREGDEWVQMEKEEERQGSSRQAPKESAKTLLTSSTPHSSRRVLSLMERKEYGSLEREIDELSERKAELERNIEELSTSLHTQQPYRESGGGRGEKKGVTTTTPQMLEKLGQQVAQLSQVIEKKSERWLELAEIEERAKAPN